MSTESRVWKYTLDPSKSDDPISIDTKIGAEFLDAQPAMSGRIGEIDVWLRVDPTANEVRRTFVVRGTGLPVPEAADTYRGTVAWSLGGRFPLVLHVFEIASGL